MSVAIFSSIGRSAGKPSSAFAANSPATMALELLPSPRASGMDCHDSRRSGVALARIVHEQVLRAGVDEVVLARWQPLAPLSVNRDGWRPAPAGPQRVPDGQREAERVETGAEVGGGCRHAHGDSGV